MSMWSLRRHFTNTSVTGAPYSIESCSLSHNWTVTLRWRVRWLKHAVRSWGRGGTSATHNVVYLSPTWPLIHVPQVERWTKVYICPLDRSRSTWWPDPENGGKRVWSCRRVVMRSALSVFYRVIRRLLWYSYVTSELSLSACTASQLCIKVPVDFTIIWLNGDEGLVVVTCRCGLSGRKV